MRHPSPDVPQWSAIRTEYAINTIVERQPFDLMHIRL